MQIIPEDVFPERVLFNNILKYACYSSSRKPTCITIPIFSSFRIIIIFYYNYFIIMLKNVKDFS
jgi:hypothetical protein